MNTHELQKLIKEVIQYDPSAAKDILSSVSDGMESFQENAAKQNNTDLYLFAELFFTLLLSTYSKMGAKDKKFFIQCTGGDLVKRGLMVLRPWRESQSPAMRESWQTLVLLNPELKELEKSN